jgi:YbgC/YbaW family acyl-CoA thioester hydrolase
MKPSVAGRVAVKMVVSADKPHGTHCMNSPQTTGSADSNPADPASAAAFRHLERLRVRWAEVDMQKIVFNGHYLLYFDTAVAGYWRALAAPYHDTVLPLGGDFFVRKATVEYEGSARYDDDCRVGVRCARLGNSSMSFAVALFRGEQRLVHGELLYVYANPATQKSQPIPASLRAVFESYEAGQPMWEVQTGTWGQLGAAARVLRQRVLVDAEGLPAALAEDADDAQALHALAVNRLGLPIGTARLGPSNNGQAVVGRAAVHEGLRGVGLAKSMLDSLAKAAMNRGDTALTLDARPSAVPVFKRLGFTEAGPLFQALGRSHQGMIKAL